MVFCREVPYCKQFQDLCNAFTIAPLRDPTWDLELRLWSKLPLKCCTLKRPNSFQDQMTLWRTRLRWRLIKRLRSSIGLPHKAPVATSPWCALTIYYSYIFFWAYCTALAATKFLSQQNTHIYIHILYHFISYSAGCESVGIWSWQVLGRWGLGLLKAKVRTLRRGRGGRTLCLWLLAGIPSRHQGEVGWLLALAPGNCLKQHEARLSKTKTHPDEPKMNQNEPRRTKMKTLTGLCCWLSL